MAKTQKEDHFAGPTGSFDPDIYENTTWGPDEVVAPENCIILDQFQISTQLFNRVIQQYREIRPYLVSCGIFSIRELLGIEFWNGLSSIEKRLAHLCMQHLAGEVEAEFYNANPDGEPAFLIH